MSALAAACDVASAVGSACAHASPIVNAPTVQQWSGQVSQSAHDLIGSFLDNGPVAWLGLLITLYVLKGVSSFLFVVLFPRKDR